MENEGEGPLEKVVRTWESECGETAGPAVVLKVRDANPAMRDG